MRVFVNRLDTSTIILTICVVSVSIWAYELNGLLEIEFQCSAAALPLSGLGNPKQESLRILKVSARILYAILSTSNKD